MSEKEKMLSIKGIYKHFGDNNVLNGVNIEVEKGEVVVILGPSGSGKTTMLRCINFLETADEGSITVNQYTITSREKSKKKIRTLRRKTAMVFQQYNLFRNRTAVENVMEGLIIVKKMDKAAARKKAEAALAEVGLLEKKDFYPAQLSGGQQQRVAIARTLAPEPEVLFIDEPFAGLRMDEIVGQQALLRAVAQRTTLVVASRSIFGFSELFKRTIVLNKGRIANEAGSNLFARTDAKARVRLRVACAPAKAKAAFQFIPGILDIDFRSAPEKGVWDILIDSDGQEDIRAQVQLWEVTA